MGCVVGEGFNKKEKEREKVKKGEMIGVKEEEEEERRGGVVHERMADNKMESRIQEMAR
jgi:hypothetical protein